MHQWDSSNVVFHWPFWTKLSWVMPKMQCMILSRYTDLSWFVWRRAPLEDFGGLTPSVIHWHPVVSKPFKPGHSPIKTKIELGIKWSNKLVYNEYNWHQVFQGFQGEVNFAQLQDRGSACPRSRCPTAPWHSNQLDFATGYMHPLKLWPPKFPLRRYPKLIGGYIILFYYLYGFRFSI